jgi:murein L,D-transpeptidase YafK
VSRASLRDKPDKPAAKSTQKRLQPKGPPFDITSSDESMHNMEARIPWKKQHSKKYASRTIRFNAHGKVVAEESNLDDNRKTPAKMSKRKATRKSNKKPVSADSMDTSSDESDKKKKNSDNKEEKAFLKSIEKPEKSPFEDTTDDESE